FTLVSAAFEIVMVSRKEHTLAAFVYAGSDLVRTALFVLPALAFGSLRGVLIGAAAFAALRVAAMFVYLWREFGRGLQLDLALWRLCARAVIGFLFTRPYLASGPVFMLWCLMILPSAFSVDSVLRAYAQTRFLLVMNIVRLAVIAVLIGWFLNHFGMIGAVLV